MATMPMTAPDGSKLESYDRPRTLEAYAGIDADGDCRCEDCRHFRRAFDASRLDINLRAACEMLGIDVNKALEVLLVTVDRKTSLCTYYGHYPFFGTVVDHRSSEYCAWSFTSITNGTVRIAEDAVAIDFFVELPWLLTEAGGLHGTDGELR